MKKFVLKSDAVQVESFVALDAPVERGRGTVRGNGDTEGDTCSMMGSCPTYPESCAQTCGEICSMTGSCPTQDGPCDAF